MMEQIADWLKQVVAMFIIAGFLELILPNNELKRVTKLVMGLVMLIMVIQPLLSIFNLPVDLTKSLLTEDQSPVYSADSATVIKKGLQLRDSWSSFYQKQLENEIEMRINRVFELNGLEGNHQFNLVYQEGRLRKIKIILKPFRDQNEHSSQSEIMKEVIHLIGSVTGLPEKQIEVIWHVGKQ